MRVSRTYIQIHTQAREIPKHTSTIRPPYIHLNIRKTFHARAFIPYTIFFYTLHKTDTHTHKHAAYAHASHTEHSGWIFMFPFSFIFIVFYNLRLRWLRFSLDWLLLLLMCFLGTDISTYIYSCIETVVDVGVLPG